VIVQQIEADGPAYNTGLQQGDLIIAMNGTAVGSIDDLHKLLDDTTIRRPCELIVLRRGRKVRVRVVPGEVKG
jgi:serine protease Do